MITILLLRYSTFISNILVLKIVPPLSTISQPLLTLSTIKSTIWDDSRKFLPYFQHSKDDPASHSYAFAVASTFRILATINSSITRIHWLWSSAPSSTLWCQLLYPTSTETRLWFAYSNSRHLSASRLLLIICKEKSPCLHIYEKLLIDTIWKLYVQI